MLLSKTSLCFELYHHKSQLTLFSYLVVCSLWFSFALSNLTSILLLVFLKVCFELSLGVHAFVILGDFCYLWWPYSLTSFGSSSGEDQVIALNVSKHSVTEADMLHRCVIVELRCKTSKLKRQNVDEKIFKVMLFVKIGIQQH